MNNSNAETCTFLMTDVEGSTPLWLNQPDRMRESLLRHDELFHQVIPANRGRVLKSRGEGDSHFCVFPDVSAALAAALELQKLLQTEQWSVRPGLRVRMAIHTAGAEERDADLYGIEVNRCARLRGIAHGGQVVLSQAANRALCDRLPDSVTLRPLGAVRLRDIPGLEQVSQLDHPELKGDFPPLRSEDRRRGNLPRALSSLVGRETELSTLCALIERHPLVSLIGPGGAGKSRLALRAGELSAPGFQDGVWWVDLAPLPVGTPVIGAVAAALGLQQSSERDLRSDLDEWAQGHEALIVLDNCEHVIEQAAAEARRLLEMGPALKLFTTSREPLRVPGERRMSVPPLELPPALSEGEREPGLDWVLRFSSARLFQDRAADLGTPVDDRPGAAAALIRVCRTLDGMPLFLELAASRMRALSIEQIDARLSDRFRLLSQGARTAAPRHRNLAAALDWSHELLPPEHQELFRRLGVFAGGFTLTAVERMWQLGRGDDIDLMEGLQALTESSMLRCDRSDDEPRYGMLETLRVYALGRLKEAGESDHWRSAHAGWACEEAELWGRRLDTSSSATCAERAMREMDNFRAALVYCCIEAILPEVAHRLAQACGRMWRIRGHLLEARVWMDRVLKLRQVRREVLGDSLVRAGILGWLQGDWAYARGCYEECLEIRRERGDLAGAASALNNLAILASEQGDLEAAEERYLQSLALYRSLERLDSVVAVLTNLGSLASRQGRFALAIQHLQESLRLQSTGGPVSARATTLTNLAGVHLGMGDLVAAEGRYVESLSLLRDLGERRSIGLSLDGLGQVAQHRGDLVRAVRCYLMAVRLTQSVGAALPPEDAERIERDLSLLRREMGDVLYGKCDAEVYGVDYSELAAWLDRLMNIGDLREELLTPARM